MKIVINQEDLIDKLNDAFISLSKDYDAPPERDGVDEFCRQIIKEAIEFYCTHRQTEISKEI